MSIESTYVLTNTIDLGIGWLIADTGTKDYTLVRKRQTIRIQRVLRMDKPARQHTIKVHTTKPILPSYQLSHQNCSKTQSQTRIVPGFNCKPKVSPTKSIWPSIKICVQYRHKLTAPPYGNLVRNYVTISINQNLTMSIQGSTTQGYPNNFTLWTSCFEPDNPKNISRLFTGLDSWLWKNKPSLQGGQFKSQLHSQHCKTLDWSIRTLYSKNLISSGNLIRVATGKKRQGIGQHYHLIQIPFDVELDQEIGLACVYQIFLHFKKPKTTYIGDAIITLAKERFQSMKIELGTL